MAGQNSLVPIGQRGGGVLSTDNALPERHIVMETLRRAAEMMSLKPPVLATLDAMLSCLAPKRNHNIVFASNATLVFRRNGISERSLRRHVSQLQEAGLIARNDSANGKRFTKADRVSGSILRFGFDLSPLFQRFADISAMAAQAEANQSHLAILRSRIRAALQHILRKDPDNSDAQSTLKLLRRKLPIQTLKALFEALPKAGDFCAEVMEKATDLASNDSQNDRHHHKAKKENIETPPPVENLSLPTLLEACPATAELSPTPIRDETDVIQHSQTLAPMLGIDQTTWIKAENSLGLWQTALTIWAIVQQQDRISKSAAYFQSVTIGNRSADFDAVKWIKRLAKGAESAAPRPPIPSL